MSSYSIIRCERTKFVLKEMKKIEYQAPKMEVVKITVQNPLLDVSTTGGSTPGFGGDADDDDTF